MNQSLENGRSFRIRGMDCAEEVAALRAEVGPVVGGADRLVFDVLRARMTISVDANGVTAEQILKAVAKTGMGAEPWRDEAPADGDDARQWRVRASLTAASGLATTAGFLMHAAIGGGLRAALSSHELAGTPAVPVVSRCLYGVAILAGLWMVLPKAWHAARRLRPDMNLLMVIAVAGAVAIDQWFEAATVAFLFALSLLLESWSVARARRAIASLMDLAPATARIRDADGGERVVAPDQVAVGQFFIVKPGERFPLDGRVVEGHSPVNQAPITGESRPVDKAKGDEVFAGTINGDGALVVECTKPASGTTLAHMIRLIGEARAKRAPSEQWVEKFARVYTPAVMALALVVLLVPPLVFGQDWQTWIYNALVLLVIACPCALVISTPVSIVAALTAAARQGVLIKGGAFIEAPARLKAIALDKTGTLTAGKPVVLEVVPLSGHDEREVIERAAAMESRSEHPLARAILAYAAGRGIVAMPADDFQVIKGKGATARFDGRQFWLGSHRYLEERKQETPEVHARLEAMESDGRSVVVVGNEGHVCGLIALGDELRPNVRQLLTELRQAGVHTLVMLTGDNDGTARAIGKEAGIDDVRSELLPADKLAIIAELVDRYGNVAMVGDGVNDAPALARATIGIAMGAAGSDAAIETADIALMSDDLSKLPWLVRHSRRTLAVIRQNITFALATKAAFVILTFAGAASLWAAIAADTGASLLVIANGLRLLNGAKKP